jgi:SAM-dependent methyltransferase
VLNFVTSSVAIDDVAGKSVLEVGSMDVNGSARSVLTPLDPSRYVGIDMVAGRGVDQVMSVSFLTDHFGPEAFDLVVSTEMLEHVQDWRWAVAQLKRVTRSGGCLLVTTRSPGFHYHGYPHDFWRFTVDDFRHIFSDMHDVSVESDESSPGVFVFARRPTEFQELDLSGYEVATSPEPVAVSRVHRRLARALRDRASRLRI